MPKDVTSIRASAFANTNLDKIDMRNCISILCDEGIFGDGGRLRDHGGEEWNINRY